MPGEAFLELVGGSVGAAVEAVWAATRALWVVHAEDVDRGGWPVQPHTVPVPRDRYSKALERKVLESPLAAQPGLNLDKLEHALLGELYYTPDTAEVNVRWFSTFYAVGRLLRGVQSEADLRYAAIRSLRANYLVAVSPDSAALMHVLSGPARSVFAAEHNGEADLEGRLLPALYGALSGSPTRFPRLFVELCTAVESFVPASRPKFVRRGPGPLEAEALLNICFGFPTSILGFDDLFGGGGLMLADAVQDGNQSKEPDPMGTRLVLVMGPFGSGKTLLSLQMAVEVARKGGIAWVLTFEQTPHECQYALESIGVSVNSPYFTFVADRAEVFPMLVRPSSGHGGLVFVPGKPDDAGDYGAFVKRIENKLEWLQQYPLRLLVIDPFNAIYPTKDPNAVESRARTVALLQQAKKAGVNVWMTAEQTSESSIEGRFEENIADTVIRLGVERGYAAQRYVEITKSRWQRERSGRRPLTITSDSGLRVHSSPSDYLAAAPGSQKGPRTFVSISVPGLDDLLGEGAIASDDIIALHGVLGTSKTLVGLQFLRGGAAPSRRALLVADISEDRMAELISAVAQPAAEEKTSAESILLLSIKPGLTDPGRILFDLKTILEKQRQADDPIERVVITNLSRWELQMPHLASDPAFGIGLLALLRTYGPTCLLISGSASEQTNSALTQLLLEESDCALELSRIDFRGQDKYFLRVLKTHNMAHRRGRFELIADHHGIRVAPKESLIRIDPAGNVRHVAIRLFLHSETLIHKHYNRHIRGGLRTTLSTDITIESPTRRYDPNVLSLGASSGIDQVQVLQLDEFQLPQTGASRNDDSGPLYRFEGSGIDRFLEGRLPGCSKGCMHVSVDGKRFLTAVPFYENISLLTYRSTHFPKTSGFPETWISLIESYREWLQKPHGEDELFFVCQVAQSDRYESYNCLFLEMLHSVEAPPTGTECDLYAWLTADPVKTRTTLEHFRILVRPCHVRMFRSDWQSLREAKWQKRQTELTRRAVVARHWYNTLNQMLSDATAEDARDIQIVPLFGAGPGNYISTSGAWYLSVPSYSAAPRVALDIIDYLTTAREEIQRVHLGIGLPTRSDYYGATQKGGGGSASVSPYFDLDRSTLRDLVENAFRRSRFHCYQSFADTLSAHLQRVLEFPDDADDIPAQIEAAFQSLRANLVFIRKRSPCDSCREKNSTPGRGSLPIFP